MKKVLATYRDAEDLINIGAYKAGSNKDIDFAIEKIEAVNTFLMQGTDEKFLFNDIVNQMASIFEDAGTEGGDG
jgi:flagellum-specific ATP synthase